MARRIDRIFDALKSTTSYEPVNEENNNYDLSKAIQDAEIIFSDAAGEDYSAVGNVDSVEAQSASECNSEFVDAQISDFVVDGEVRMMMEDASDEAVAPIQLSIVEIGQRDSIFDEIPSCSGVQSTIIENLTVEDCESSDLDESDHTPCTKLSDKILEDEGPRRKRSTKYEVNKNKWHENKNRIKREKGESYVGKKKENGMWKYDILKEPRSLEDVCRCKLSNNQKSVLKCRELTENERKNIFKEFWQYTWAEKRVFVKNHVSINYTIRKRGIRDVSRRSYSNRFFLGKDRLRVCRTMFLNTLGVKEWVIKKWAKSNLENGYRKDEDNVQPNKIRDSTTAPTRSLHDFFDCLPKLESHYCRASTSKLYLEPTWNSKAHLYKIYKNDYCTTHNVEPVSIATFHKEFDKKRLSLYKPKKDLCDTCVAFETGNLTEYKYNEHIAFKNAARTAKTVDKESPNEVFTMDLQSVLLSPKSNTCALYYKTKLIVHNFTLYDIKRNQGYCYLWNEAEGGLTNPEDLLVHHW
ncbi:unnamed protein product [Acanthoscelides obtectus]|uniref:Uncharacterized protein n=1 Tax=Acanthoscelides obtectus TaxID=200917 RepID=A0A9P0P0W7_ACAOB|nr:unnamed protein product [Acanthoscelides obtectus]CAK1646684.1 hypothetical protein AOBTE_LOCUS14813 [Acanthoscelides obtectus]